MEVEKPPFVVVNRLKLNPVQSDISIFFPALVEIPVANLRNKKMNKVILSTLLDAIDNGNATLSYAGLFTDPEELITETNANHKDFKTATLFQYHSPEPIFDFSKEPGEILKDFSKAVRSAPYAMRYADREESTGRTIIYSVMELI